MAKSFRQKNDVVYHCIPVPPEAGSIQVSTKYGTKIPSSILQHFNAKAEDKIPLVFAAAKKSKAVAYSFQFALHEVLMLHSIEIDGCNQEMAVICNRKEVMSRQRDATIYEIPASNFVDLDGEQCVSDSPVPLDTCGIALRITNGDDIMRGGVQVFGFEGTFEEWETSGLKQQFRELFTKHDLYTNLGNWVREGKLVWENKERQINIEPSFAKAMGFNLGNISKIMKKLPYI